MDRSVLEEKLSFKVLGLIFSYKLDLGFDIIFLTKTASKEIEALIRSMKILSPEIALYLNKSIIRPCMNYCCHVCPPSSYLELLGKLHAASLELLAHHWNITSLSLFYRYYFYRCSSALVELAPILYSWGKSTHYSDRLHDFSFTIPRHYKDVYVSSSFSCTASLWNYLPIEYFPLTYDLSGLTDIF